MIIGTCIVEFYIPCSRSLKDKRRVLKSTLAKIRNKFNVSVAEINSHELWSKAVIGIVCIDNDSRHANKVLSNIINMLENEPCGAEIVSHKIEVW
jgi:hypothetical protein